jgi:hypothetical protein
LERSFTGILKKEYRLRNSTRDEPKIWIHYPVSIINKKIDGIVDRNGGRDQTRKISHVCYYLIKIIAVRHYEFIKTMTNRHKKRRSPIEFFWATPLKTGRER